MKGRFGHLNLLYLIVLLNFPFKFPYVQVAHCGECFFTERETTSWKPGVEILLLFSFTSFFFSCKQTIYRKVVFVFPFLVSKKKSSGLINHYLLQSIALELTISDRFVKEKPRRLSLNRIVKE